MQAFQVALPLSGKALEQDPLGQTRETYFLKKTEREGLDPLPEGSHTPSPACSAFRNKSALKVGSSESKRRSIFSGTDHIYF